MGELVPFKSRQAKSLVKSENGESARILFFTGVRYCRQDEPAENGPHRPSGHTANGGRARKSRRRA
jgi:hypothetical protein